MHFERRRKGILGDFIRRIGNGVRRLIVLDHLDYIFQVQITDISKSTWYQGLFIGSDSLLQELQTLPVLLPYHLPSLGVESQLLASARCQ